MEEGNEILYLEWSGAGKRPGHQEGAASVQVTGKAWAKQGLVVIGRVLPDRTWINY